MVWKALGLLSTVCSLPGSWITHVDGNLIDFEDDGDKQCIAINSFLLGVDGVSQ